MAMLAVFAALRPVALAQPDTPPGDADSLRVSLHAAIERALRVGVEIQGARSQLDIARAMYVQARSTALPQLNLSVGYTRQLESAFSGTMPRIQPFEADTSASEIERIEALEDALPTASLVTLGRVFSSTAFASENSWVASLAISQRVFEGGLVWHSIAAARHAIRSAESTRDDRERDIVMDVRAAYLNALLADQGVRIAELSLAQAETQLRRAQLRAEVGESSEFELLQAEVARDNLTPAVLQARTNREVAYLEIKRLINVPAAAPLVLTSPVLNDQALPENPAAVDTAGLVARALRAPAIRALAEAVEAREHAVPAIASSRWPALSLNASYSEQAYPGGDVFPSSDDWLKDVRAGAQLSWNLFDGLRTSGAVQQAKAERDQARQLLRQAREQVKEIVVQNQSDLLRAAADLAARSRTVQLASRAYDLASLRYEEGAGDLLEVGDARISYQVAQINEAQARHDFFLALARLERYSGQPVFSSIAPQQGE
jgi:outer membrane protein TolC